MKTAVFWKHGECLECSEEYAISIFMINQQPLSYLQMGAAVPLKQLQTSARLHHISEDSNLHSHCCKNLKSQIPPP